MDAIYLLTCPKCGTKKELSQYQAEAWQWREMIDRMCDKCGFAFEVAYQEYQTPLESLADAGAIPVTGSTSTASAAPAATMFNVHKGYFRIWVIASVLWAVAAVVVAAYNFPSYLQADPPEIGTDYPALISDRLPLTPSEEAWAFLRYVLVSALLVVGVPI